MNSNIIIAKKYRVGKGVMLSLPEPQKTASAGECPRACRDRSEQTIVVFFLYFAKAGGTAAEAQKQRADGQGNNGVRIAQQAEYTAEEGTQGEQGQSFAKGFSVSAVILDPCPVVFVDEIRPAPVDCPGEAHNQRRCGEHDDGIQQHGNTSKIEFLT
jgi:hypothetical protein